LIDTLLINSTSINAIYFVCLTAGGVGAILSMLTYIVSRF